MYVQLRTGSVLYDWFVYLYNIYIKVYNYCVPIIGRVIRYLSRQLIIFYNFFCRVEYAARKIHFVGADYVCSAVQNKWFKLAKLSKRCDMFRGGLFFLRCEKFLTRLTVSDVPKNTKCRLLLLLFFFNYAKRVYSDLIF